ETPKDRVDHSSFPVGRAGVFLWRAIQSPVPQSGDAASHGSVARRDLGSIHRAPEPWSSPSGTRSFGQSLGGRTNGEQNRASNEGLVAFKGSPCYRAADAQRGQPPCFRTSSSARGATSLSRPSSSRTSSTAAV